MFFVPHGFTFGNLIPIVMKIMNTAIHGFFDIILGSYLLLSPWLLGYYAGGVETYIPVGIGAIMLVLLLITNYEMGLVKKIDFKVHQMIDVTAAVFLAVSPWIFGFATVVFWPHLILGYFIAGTSLITYCPVKSLSTISNG
jgi:hypothetical protein